MTRKLEHRSFASDGYRERLCKMDNDFRRRNVMTGGDGEAGKRLTLTAKPVADSAREDVKLGRGGNPDGYRQMMTTARSYRKICKYEIWHELTC